MPPSLPEPLFTAKLKPEVVVQQAQLSKDKAKKIRPQVKNFRTQDQAICSLSIEYMEALVATVCAFPDEATRWLFAALSNHWASKKLGHNYRLQPNSEHCRLVRICQ
jgi:hypothetical protein